MSRKLMTAALLGAVAMTAAPALSQPYGGGGGWGGDRRDGPYDRVPDGDWQTTRRKDGKVHKKFKARDLWKQLHPGHAFRPTTTLRFAQESKATAAAAKLRAMIKVTATVLRDGVERELPLRELVPGDVVLLSAGDMIPGDARILNAKDQIGRAHV